MTTSLFKSRKVVQAGQQLPSTPSSGRGPGAILPGKPTGPTGGTAEIARDERTSLVGGR